MNTGRTAPGGAVLRPSVAAAILAAAVCTASPVQAQGVTGGAGRIEAAALPSAFDPADVAWMLVASA
ncbi:MAG TPA: hypothetical protein VF170_00415, partial [Planctomycetaceae bacterium]